MLADTVQYDFIYVWSYPKAEIRIFLGFKEKETESLYFFRLSVCPSIRNFF